MTLQRVICNLPMYVTVNDVDKCQRIGPTDNDGKQTIIIKFTKHSTAAKVFREGRRLSKTDQLEETFRTSLTRQ